MKKRKVIPYPIFQLKFHEGKLKVGQDNIPDSSSMQLTFDPLCQLGHSGSLRRSFIHPSFTSSAHQRSVEAGKMNDG